MGAPMAGHLLDAGHELTVHNRTRERELPLAERGAARAATPAEAADGADAVLICVSDTPDLEAVLFGADGVAQGLAAGGIVIDCSTVSPSATAELAERLAAQGIGLVDAPVSGGSEGAQNGTLTIFVGGSPEHVERAQPILRGVRQAHHAPRPQRLRPDGQGGEPGDDRRHVRHRRRGHRAGAGRRPAAGAADGGALGRSGVVVGAREQGPEHGRRQLPARVQGIAAPQGRGDRAGRGQAPGSRPGRVAGGAGRGGRPDRARDTATRM